MAVPLIVLGAAAAAGAAAGGAAKAERDGKSAPRHSGSFQETKYYDPEATQYGGRRGGLQDYNANLNYRRGLAESRTANTANYTGANHYFGRTNAWEEQGLGARAEQGQIANLMHRRAAGGPSIAGMQAQQSMGQLGRQTDRQIGMINQNAALQARQAQAAQGAQAASARGAAGVALAGQTAANNTANAQGAIGRGAAMASQNVAMGSTDAARDIATQAQVNAANEQFQAEQAAFGAYSGMRGGDMSAQGIAGQLAQSQAGMSQFQAQQEQANRDANDRRAMGYEQLEAQANLGAQSAAVANQGQLAQSHAAADAHNAAAYAEREKNDKGWAESIFGGIKDGASAVSDTRAKQQILLDQGRQQGRAEVRDLGDVDAADDRALDDRYAQHEEAQRSQAFQGQLASQVAQDREDLDLERRMAAQRAEDDRRMRDPAVGLGRTPRGYARMRAAQVPAEEEADPRYAGMAPGTADFERTEPKAKEPWWMTPVSVPSDERTKKRTDIDKPFTMSDQITAKQMEGLRSPKAFKRDTPAQQKKVKEDYYAKLARQADEQMAGMRASLGKGAAVARDEGEIDNDTDQRMAFTSDESAKKEAYLLGRAHQHERDATGKAPDGGFEWNPTEQDDIKDTHINPEKRVGLSKGQPKEDPDSFEAWSKAAGPGGVKASPERSGSNPYSASAKAAGVRPPENAGEENTSKVAPSMAMSSWGWLPGAGAMPHIADAAQSYGQSLRPPPREMQSFTRDAPQAGRAASVSTPDERLGWPYDAGKASLSDERTKDLGVDRGPVAEANRAMRGQPYAYKDEHVPPNERRGQPHFGFMAQNLEKSPVAATAVEKDESGLRRVDTNRMLQVVASGVSDLQRQQDELRVGLGKGKRKK